MKKGFIKGEALRLLRTNSSQITFKRNIRNFHNRLLERGYPAAILRKYLPEVKELPLISYRKGKSLKNLLVRAKLSRPYNFQYD